MTLLFSSIVSNWTVTSYQRSLKFLLVVLGLLVNQVAYPQAVRGSESIKALLEHSASDKQSAIEQTPRNLYVSKFTKEYVNLYLPWLSERLEGLEVIELDIEGSLTEGDRSRRRSNFPSDGHGWLLLEINLRGSHGQKADVNLVDGCWTFEDWSCRHSSLDKLIGSERGLFGGMDFSALKAGEGELPPDAKVLFTFHMRSAKPVLPQDREIYCEAYVDLVELGLEALASGSSERKAISAVRKEEKVLANDFLNYLNLSMTGGQDDFRKLIRSLYAQARKNSVDFLKIITAGGNEKMIENMTSLGSPKLSSLLTPDCLSKLPKS